MNNKLPIFKYHKNPVHSGSIEKGDFLCPICKKTKPFAYVGPFFSKENVKNICPWCIADGSAAKMYNGKFQDSASIESEVSNQDLDELVHRTPGYMGWQQEKWLVHCCSPCQYISHVGWKEILHNNIDVEEDILKLSEAYRISTEKFKARLVNNGSLQGYLFQCIKCGKYRLTADCD